MEQNIFDILKQVFSSWQVIVVTLVILAYIHLVSYVSRKHHRAPRQSKKINLFKKRAAKPVMAADNTDDVLSGSSSNDELGLEEA